MDADSSQRPEPAESWAKLVALLEDESLESFLTEGARLLALEAASAHAAVFLADGSGPLREFWHCPPGDRDRVRASFKSLALESARIGAVLGPRPIAAGEEALLGLAIPLRTREHTVGAICVSRPDDETPVSSDRLTRVGALTSILAVKIRAHQEVLRYRAQRARDERWFKTLDGHLRVLDRERQKFAAFVNQTDILALVLDPERTIRWTNRAMSELFPPENGGTWVGRSCRDLCRRLGSCAECPITRALAADQVVHHEIAATPQEVDGLLYLTALPIRSPNGKTEEILLTLQDLTSLESLRRSEARYRTVLAGAPVILFAIDREGVFTLSEGRALESLGLKPGQVVGQSVFEVYRDHPAILENVRRALGGENLDAVVEVGPLRFETRYAPLHDAAGAVRGVIGVATDVTERARAERALRDSEARKSAILDTALDCIVTIDHEGRVTEFNRTAERTFGYTREEAVGRDLAELIIPPTLREQHRTGMERLRATGEGRVLGRRVEMTGMRADGSEFPVELAVARIPNSDPPAYTGYVRDLTERKEAEAALRRSEEQLRQAQKMEAVGVLAGGVAHDFNNLLTVIHTQSEMLLRLLPPGSAARGKAEEIQAASTRGAMLTRQLLTFSRNEVLAPQTLDLNTVVAELQGMLRRLIGEDIEIRWLPASGPAHVRADRGQIEQVVMNLAANARDAMTRGGVLRIQVAHVELDEVLAGELLVERPGAFCSLTMEDTGCGMEREILSRVFEPFFTTKERGRGTGLGLSTVYAIAKQGGGSVTVSSEPGRGSTFTVYVPSVESEVSTRPEPRPEAPARGTETILLVEDEPGVRAIGRDLLEYNGYQVLEAENGAAALALAERHAGPIHLLLTDVVMPIMGGRELAERLAAQRPGIGVLYVSGFTDDMVVRHGVLDSGVAFLQKPFTLDSLSRKVREVLDDPRRQPQVH